MKLNICFEKPMICKAMIDKHIYNKELHSLQIVMLPTKKF